MAAGKGVLICKDKDDALKGLAEIMKDKVFGSAGDLIVIEEFLEGEEVSIFALCDGENYLLLSPSQDHKKANENFINEVESTTIKPSLQAMRQEGTPYKGVLYFGLIITKEGPKVLEYNCRFGDPETEVVLPLLDSDLVPLMLATIDGYLKNFNIKLKAGYAVDVVLASGGYPDSYEKGKVIETTGKLDKDIIVFHAGTATQDHNLVTSGGRVLNVVALGEKFRDTQKLVYENIKMIVFEKMVYRNDIGNKALKHL